PSVCPPAATRHARRRGGPSDVVGDAADGGGPVLHHVLRQRRAEPRIDDHHRARADARVRARGGDRGAAGTRGQARVRGVAGGAAARVHRAHRALDRVVGAARRQLAVLGGVALGSVAVCSYALLTKVFPGQLGPSNGFARLAEPFGYWNAVGLTAAIGAICCMWLGSRRDGHALRAALAYPAMGVLL